MLNTYSNFWNTDQSTTRQWTPNRRYHLSIFSSENFCNSIHSVSMCKTFRRTFFLLFKTHIFSTFEDIAKNNKVVSGVWCIFVFVSKCSDKVWTAWYLLKIEGALAISCRTSGLHREQLSLGHALFISQKMIILFTWITFTSSTSK